jgi:tripartite-type tricarboxylate transporter receptor subunit TctC
MRTQQGSILDMTDITRRASLAALLASAALPGTALAAEYPDRSVEIVVPSSAGGGTDIVARAFTDVARKYVSQPFVVVNKPGASGAIGMGDVLNSRPDGYKISMAIVELAILPLLNQIKFSVDDFKMVARLNGDPASIVVRRDSPWNSIDAFIADAKARPGQINLGNSGIGSIWHLAGAALESKVGVQFLHVPYPGSAPGLLALIGGHLDAMAVSPGEASVHVRDGKLKVLAAMSAQRVPGFDDVPTLRERDIDLVFANWRGIAVPKATPQPVVEALTTITRKVANDPAFREALTRSNLAHAYLEGAEFDAAIARDREFFKQITANINLN